MENIRTGSVINGTVDGGGNVKLYFVTASNLFTLDDTLGSSGGTWTGTAITQLPPTFSGRVRSVAVVPAAIPPPSYSVNTATAGGGFGSVAKSPATGPYVKCSTVTLTATANPGSIFVNWTGDVPNPPTNVVALALSTTQIRVTWSDNSNNEDHFVVYVGTTVMAVLGPNVTTYTDSSLSPGVFRCYRVEATNTYGSSPSPSDGCTSTPHGGISSGPAAPSQFRAAATTTTQVRLTWADNSNDEDGFKVYEEGSAAPPTLVGANVTALTVTGVLAAPFVLAAAVLLLATPLSWSGNAYVVAALAERSPASPASQIS